jgi:hypothetical protein
MQVEVYATYQCPGAAGKKAYCHEVRLPPGRDLDPGDRRHADHSHVSEWNILPDVQPDHGAAGSEFSVGPYVMSEDKKTVTYMDPANMAAAIFPKVVKFFPKEITRDGRTCELSTIRVVERFITVVYLGGKPVRTVHWTSTFEGFPDARGDDLAPNRIWARIIDELEGGQGTSGYANKCIRDNKRP